MTRCASMIDSISRDTALTMQNYLRTVILLVLTFAIINGKWEENKDDCGSQDTCTACIRTRNCTWCNVFDDEFSSPLRCVTRHYAEKNRNTWCSKGKPVNEINSERLIDNIPLFTASGTGQVQIQPQTVELKLRLGEEHRLKVKYKQAEAYPVDLYFLIDMSNSMRFFRTHLAKLTNGIVKGIENLTTNIQLGFGGFIDKTIHPMIPAGSNESWDDHHAFKNLLPLTNDYIEFESKVGRVPVIVSGADAPESGFDGMMQVIVCHEEIGWRPNARHIIVHASDYSPHIAGDGKLAGIIEPNDEQCHLQKETGLYTHAELQDYPSLGQINWQAKKNNVHIIFAANSTHKETYEQMRSVIESSAVGTFTEDSDDIVELISGQYEKLVKSVKMTSNSNTDILDIKFFSECVAKNGKLEQTNKCDDIHVDDTVEFVVEIRAIRCPNREEDRHRTIKIKPEGINEGMVVNVELICECECSKKSNEERNGPRKPECHNHGIIECGICSCDPGHFGKWCQCERNDTWTTDTDALTADCRRGNSSDLCSGVGSCVCGECICHQKPKRFYGQFCECDDSSCRYSSEGKHCGGPERGSCKCGKCECKKGWSGPACECTDDPTQCRLPGDDVKVCSGFGKCDCGQCICDPEKKRTGQFCEDCPSCGSQRCDEFKECVECIVHKSGNIYAIYHDCLKCHEWNITLVDEIEEDSDRLKLGEHVCRVPGNDGSTFVFKYVYDGGNNNEFPVIIAEKDKQFPKIDDFIFATLGVVLLTLLIGFLILLIWKITTNINDKREFEKFEKERAQVKWGRGENPLYVETITYYHNPTFESTINDEDLPS